MSLDCDAMIHQNTRFWGEALPLRPRSLCLFFSFFIRSFNVFSKSLFPLPTSFFTCSTHIASMRRWFQRFFLFNCLCIFFLSLSTKFWTWLNISYWLHVSDKLEMLTLEEAIEPWLMFLFDWIILDTQLFIDWLLHLGACGHCHCIRWFNCRSIIILPSVTHPCTSPAWYGTFNSRWERAQPRIKGRLWIGLFIEPGWFL